MKRLAKYVGTVGIVAGLVTGPSLDALCQEDESPPFVQQSLEQKMAEYIVRAEKVELTKIFYGVLSEQEIHFTQPIGYLSFSGIIIETPEYKQIRKEKVERGEGKYWILMSQASDRAMRSIISFAEDSSLGLILDKEYFLSDAIHIKARASENQEYKELSSADKKDPAYMLTDDVIKLMKSQDN